MELKNLEALKEEIAYLEEATRMIEECKKEIGGK